MEASYGPVRGNSRKVSQPQKALEDAGVEFLDATDDRGPGVRLRSPSYALNMFRMGASLMPVADVTTPRTRCDVAPPIRD
ncbi:MAG: hypothetical protein IH905_05120 [Proteobacteria bacterium]|nr:hypothetical protein [Pseudomonadota bacterium]